MKLLLAPDFARRDSGNKRKVSRVSSIAEVRVPEENDKVAEESLSKILE